MKNIKLSLIAVHIVAWVVFLSIPFFFIAGQSEGSAEAVLSIKPIYLLIFATYIVVFYLHTNILFPKLYLRKNYLLYFLSIAILFTAVFLLRPYDNLVAHARPDRPGITQMDDRPPPGPPPAMNNEPHRPKVDIISIALFILIIAISIAMVSEKRRHLAIERAARAEADKANAELSFLKAQINPHFLFNTLNNIYSLAITKNENVADAIMRLSNIMRYVTDDVQEAFVSLESEVNVVTDYISLQQLRLGKKVKVDFEVTGNMEGKKIAPLILIPFVENVFKHGISNAEESNIIVKLDVGDKDIVFLTQNKLFATPRVTERVGIGNTNTKKRLEFIYPGKHNLHITAEKSVFTVELVLYI